MVCTSWRISEFINCNISRDQLVRCSPSSKQIAATSHSAWSSGPLEVEDGEKQGIGQNRWQ